MLFFPVQLTTNRIVNRFRLIDTLVDVMAIRTYMNTVIIASFRCSGIRASRDIEEGDQSVELPKNIRYF